MNGGLPHDTGALTLNRLCGSGLQAIVAPSQYILLGDTDAAVAGGAESMSRAAYASLTQRWGARMGDAQDDRHDGRRADRSVRHDPHGRHRRERRGEVRPRRATQQDAFAVESHKRAAAAIAAGHFKSQILPIELKSKKGPVDVRHRRARARRLDVGGHGAS